MMLSATQFGPANLFCREAVVIDGWFDGMQTSGCWALLSWPKFEHGREVSRQMNQSIGQISGVTELLRIL